MSVPTKCLSLLLVLLLSLSLCSCSLDTTEGSASEEHKTEAFQYSSLPEYEDKAYVEVNHNCPFFTEGDYTTKAYETYGDLDRYGRCTSCMACVGQELMPTGQRERISSVKPTGWNYEKYSFVEGELLYNRCHLIAYCLTGEGANEQNLITGTRYLNAEGMLPFEEMVADYIDETNYHVLYRVTPIFQGMEDVARGVLMEAYSVEDHGEGISYCVFCYNVQPGIRINYNNGSSKQTGESTSFNPLDEVCNGSTEEQSTYVLNTKNKKFHKPNCNGVDDIYQKSKETYHGTKDQLLVRGYRPCGNCNP